MDATAGIPGELTEGLEVRRVTPVSGGDIANAYRVDTDDGPLFMKTHATPRPDMFEREAAGLRALRGSAPLTLGVPEVRRLRPSGLVLEWIGEGSPGATTEADLGRGLAELHRVTHPTFGALDSALRGYIGSQPVDLTPTGSWPEFFLERRVRPLARRAITRGRLDPVFLDVLARLSPMAAELCGPPEPPALLHGDLWAGNRLIGTEGRNWLIDPACYWGHREVDLAMMALFGGFGRDCFAAYHSTYPLADGWQERVQWYQLPPLLVHAILFGGHYGSAALRALETYR